MGGKVRPVLIAVSGFALLAIANPAAMLAGPLAAHQVAAATSDAKHGSEGDNHDPRHAPVAAAPAAPRATDGDAAAPQADATAQPSATQPAGTGPAVANGSGNRFIPAQIELSRPRGGQPSERADHASASSRGQHLGAGDDREGRGASPSSGSASSSTASSDTPSAGTEAASTQALAESYTNHSGATSTPPSVVVGPPAAPQPNPPIATQPALTGARLDWILVGVVTALAAAVVAAVRVATFRGRRPPR